MQMPVRQKWQKDFLISVFHFFFAKAYLLRAMSRFSGCFPASHDMPLILLLPLLMRRGHDGADDEMNRTFSKLTCNNTPAEHY